MAILHAAALFAAQNQAAAPTPSDDVVVIGQRLRQLKLVTKRDRTTGLRCVVKHGSGDPTFDASMCDATHVCAATATTRQAMTACLTPYVRAYADRLKEEHAAAPAKVGR